MSYLDKLLTGLGITLKNAGTALPTPVTTIDVENGDASFNSGTGEHILDLIGARVPTAHAATHKTGGSDVISNAVAAGNAGLMTGADKSKIDSQLPGTNTDAEFRGSSTATLVVGSDAIAQATATSFDLQNGIPLKVTNSDGALAVVERDEATGRVLLGNDTEDSRVIGINSRIDGGDSAGLQVSDQDVLITDGVNVDALVARQRVNYQRTAGNNGLLEFTFRESFWVASGSNYDRTLAENDWFGDGTTDTTRYAHSVVVEVEIVGQTNAGNFYRVLYQGLLYKGTGGDHLSWGIAQGLEENSAFRSPLAFNPATNGVCACSISLSGTNNGNVQFRFSPTGGDSAGNFNAKIRMFGGGKYA